MTPNEEKMRAAVKWALKNELESSNLHGEMCEVVWDHIFNEALDDKADAEAYELFKKVYNENITKMVKVLA